MFQIERPDEGKYIGSFVVDPGIVVNFPSFIGGKQDDAAVVSDFSVSHHAGGSFIGCFYSLIERVFIEFLQDMPYSVFLFDRAVDPSAVSIHQMVIPEPVVKAAN